MIRKQFSRLMKWAGVNNGQEKKVVIIRETRVSQRNKTLEIVLMYIIITCYKATDKKRDLWKKSPSFQIELNIRFNSGSSVWRDVFK